MTFRCKTKYRLEVRWDSIEYLNKNTAKLINARFEGPVLKDIKKIESPDAIDLDLTPQCLIVLDSYYFINLSWASAEHTTDGKVKLTEAIIISKGLDSLHKLHDTDFIVINTEKHREEVHAFNLVYESQISKQDKTPYVYEK